MKIRKILSLIINIFAILAAIAGICVVPNLQAIHFVKYFTLVTNTLIIVMSAISIGYVVDALIKKEQEVVLPTPIFAIKIIVGVNTLITFLTVVTYLQYSVYSGFGPNTSEFWHNLMLHYIAPLSFVAGLIFFDLDQKYPFKVSFFGIVALIIYMGYAVPFSNLNLAWWGEAPYVFMSIKNVGPWMFVLLPGFIIGGLALAILLWLLNRICYLIFIGEEINKEESEEEKEMEKKVEVTPEEINEVNNVIKTGYKGPRIYHISKREDKMWQIKFATGKKAIKLFDTQAEAIVYAKKLAKSQEGSIRVHSLKGKIRKAH